MTKVNHLKTFFCILVSTLLIMHTHAQKQAVSFNAIQVVRPDSLSEDAFEQIKPYRLVIVGESHGTKEPAALVNGLIKALLEHGDSVQIGLEIKASQMGFFLENQNDSSLLASKFFSKENHNIQASAAWANLMLRASKLPKVKLFFFDVDYGDYNSTYPRDSAMYLNIKQTITAHPSWKTIVLAGNIHSLLSLYNNIPTMGYYLAADTAMVPLISILHRYKTGELWDTSGPVPQEYEKNYKELPFTNRPERDSYLLTPEGKTNGVARAIFYTEKATRSRLLWND